MSNFRPLPRPSQASTNNLVYLSIWPEPRSCATGPTRPWSYSQVTAALLNFKAGRYRAMQWVETLAFKAWTRGTAGRGVRRKKPTTTMCSAAFKPRLGLFVFPLSISTGCIDPRGQFSSGSCLGKNPDMPSQWADGFATSRRRRWGLWKIATGRMRPNNVLLQTWWRRIYTPMMMIYKCQISQIREVEEGVMGKPETQSLYSCIILSRQHPPACVSTTTGAGQ